MAETQNTQDAIFIDYVNHKGIQKIHHIIPKSIRFGSTQWHEDPQWLLDAYDIDKDADRTFAMKDISSWHRSFYQEPVMRP